MPAYQITNGKAKRIKQVEFANESDLHLLIDSNLEEIFGIKYHCCPIKSRINTTG